MYWRIPRKEFDSNKSAGNKKLMNALVESGKSPGIIAYSEGAPIGWCAFAPRQEYSSLERSRILKPVDDRECWSVSCFFIHRKFRGKGVATALLKAAVKEARDRGAKLIEGYPVEPGKDKKYPPAFAWHGVTKLFESAGFEEVARRSSKRPIMRRELGDN